MTQLKNNNILHNNRLSVQVSLTGHSFLVTSIVTNSVIFFSEMNYKRFLSTREALEEIQKEIDTAEVLSTNISEVHIIYHNDISTVVPAPLFDETKAVEYLKFNSKILMTDYIANDTLENHDAVVVYVPYVNISNYFFETFGSFEYYHATTLFLKHVLDTEKFSASTNVHVDVQHDTFTCIISKNGKLELCNTFSFKTSEDFIYYILFCFEQLALNPNETHITLSGYISEEDANFQQMYTYIRNIKFAESKSKIYINGQPDHRHLLLKSLH